MKTIQFNWFRFVLTGLFVGLLASYLPYPGLPDLPTTLSEMFRDLQQPVVAQN